MCDVCSVLNKIQGNQRRFVDDLERWINPLFDALNCDTLSKTVVEQLLLLTQGLSFSPN